MIKYIILTTIFISQLFSLDLQNLLDDIKKQSSKELLEENKRVENFLEQKNQRQKILNDTKLELKKQNDYSVKLKNIIDKNEKKLTLLETQLNTKVGDLGEMFGSVRQTSADFLTNFQNSLSASSSNTKEDIFTKFANSKKLPNTQELEEFWYTMLDEIIKSGEISTYTSSVVLSNGERAQKTITRIGQFAAVSQGKYLTYDNELNALVELSTQPSSSIQNIAKEFENSSDQIANIVVDPTKGTLLKLIEMNPTLMDRINQGGIVGYVIIVLGAIGLLFAFYKMIVLNIEHRGIKKQLEDINTPLNNNSLGKIANTFFEHQDKSLNDLEITVSEAILKEVNKMKKGESFVKLLSAVTPLLGLLGTVTGMIATFQAITLFGTGDPKLMAGGISTALITTVLGLVAAIPLLFSYTYLSSKSDLIVSILEEQSVGMLAKSIK